MAWHNRIRYCGEGQCSGHDVFENNPSLTIDQYDYDPIVIVIDEDEKKDLVKLENCRELISDCDDITVVMTTQKEFIKCVLAICTIKKGYRRKHTAYYYAKLAKTPKSKRCQFVYGMSALHNWIKNSIPKADN